MSNEVNAREGLSKRNLVTFPIGTIGRDAACAGLFTGQLLNFVYFTKKLDAAQLLAITIIMAVARVFDAINDPIMGNIVDATHSKWGKFKPWIFIGMIGSAAIVAASFCNNLQGWGYVALFGILYFLYSIVFTMNDIGYWGMIPSLARGSADRNKLVSATALCASLGGGLCGILVPILTTGSLALGGSAVKAYTYVSLIFVGMFVVFQMVMLLGVKEAPYPVSEGKKTRVGAKQILGVLKKNDQLRWVALVFLLTQLVPLTAYTMYIYFNFGYEGTLLTFFYVFAGIATLSLNLFFPIMTKHLSRKSILRLGMIFQLVGSCMIILFTFVIPKGQFSFVIPFFNTRVTLQYIMIAFSYFFCGFAQTSYYMVLMICIANTVEYNDVKTGKRDEGIIFSVRPFLTKLGGAVQTLGVMLFYVVISINQQTGMISDLEQQAAMGNITADQKMASISEVINTVPQWKTIALMLLITVLPAILFVVAYTLFSKKFKIDEKYFEELNAELGSRAGSMVDGGTMTEAGCETIGEGE